jgi:hypothetical protein
MKSIFGTVAGSFLFGTSVERSDIDIRGVYIPSLNDIVMQRVKVDNAPLRELDTAAIYKQARGIAMRYGFGTPEDGDDVNSMPLHHFLSLVASGEVTTTELMFAPNHFWITDMTDYFVWLEVQKIRSKIVTKQIKRAVGFCNGIYMQFGVRAERLSAAIEARDLIKGLVDSHSHNALLGAYERDFLPLTELDHIELDSDDHNIKMLRVCGRGLQYTATVGNALNVLEGAVASYGKRANASLNPERKDWKSVMHALRVSEQTIELLKDGEIRFIRPNSGYLREVRSGERPMDEVTAKIDENMAVMNELVETSDLPETADMNAIEELVKELYLR